MKQYTFIILHVAKSMTMNCVVEKSYMINECTKKYNV